jgi:replicative DNA helicase
MNKLWRELAERTYLLKWPDGVKDANQFFLETCKGDVSIFRTEVDRLAQQARVNPLPDVYNLREVMTSSTQGTLTEAPNRLRFPQPDVDKMAILLPGSVLGVYSTNTSMGKTPFALQVSMHNARYHGDVVINWQCELSPEEISTIVTAQTLRKDRNTLTVEDKQKAAQLLDGVQYYIGHNPSLTDANQILDLIEAAVRRLGATCVLLDTFHNVVVSETNGTAVETAIANRIKNIAMKYRLKWINVFQPRKAQQQTKGRKTHITDIRGAGAAADTCDAIFAMHRDLNKSDDDTPLDDIYESRTLIQAQKTRAKGTGKSETYLQFFGNYGLFEQIDYNHE